MRFTLNWLKQFLDTDASLEQIAHKLTMIGLEVEDIDDKSASLAAFEVAEIIEAKPHPDADKLSICSVKTAKETLQIVCGAKNARAGIKVVLANIGTIIPNGNFKIKKTQIRGVESSGMMCALEEIGLSGDSSGIIELQADAVIGDNVAKYLGADDPVIHINITPNRSDALGVYGIARDLSAAGLGTLKKLEIPNIKADFTSNTELENNDQEACPLFTFREIRNLENKKSPKWLRNYLNNIGIEPISAIVDITNYISYTFGQPMHAYDADKLENKLIVESIQGKKLEFDALNDKSYELSSGDIVIRDNAFIHCLGGIIGGKVSSCSDNTKRIILEAASFNAENIAKTGRRLQIDTDSRYRFERNVDREFTLSALDFATNLILSICGGECSEAVQSGEDKLPIKMIKLSTEFLKSRTNLELSVNEITDILTKLGFTWNISDDLIDIEVPSWRYDVSLREDIVEEIVRIYGYDRLPETELPQASISRIIPKDQKRMIDMKRLFASCGYTEIVSWSFMDSKKAALFSEIKEELKLQNPISSDLDYMRPSILPNLLKITNNNLNRSYGNLSLFEIGPVFKDSSEKVINHLCGVRVGETANKNSHGEYRPFDVFDMKADLAEVLSLAGLDINKCQIKIDCPEYYHPTRSASLALGKNILGYFGQVHPMILKEFGIDGEVMALELDISKLPYGKNKFGMKPEYISSDYQKIIRDYAFIVDQSQPVGEMINLIKNSDKKLIKSVELFDLYSGEHIQSGKKSVALSVVIQDNHKTLSETDIEKINKVIIESAEQKFNAILRDN